MPSSTEITFLTFEIKPKSMDHEASSCASSVILEVLLKCDGPRLLLVCELLLIIIKFNVDCCSIVSGLTIRMMPQRVLEGWQRIHEGSNLTIEYFYFDRDFRELFYVSWSQF